LELKKEEVPMSRQRTAALVITVALSVATPSFTYAATQPRNESRDFTQDRDSLVARTIKNIKRIIKALEGPMIPPPVVIPPTPDEAR
jgi:hypothetical protein